MVPRPLHGCQARPPQGTRRSMARLLLRGLAGCVPGVGLSPLPSRRTMGHLRGGYRGWLDEEDTMRRAIWLARLSSVLLVASLLASACAGAAPWSSGGGQKPSELKIAMVDFMSG